MFWPGGWCEKPGRALEQIGIGKLHAGLFFPGHGVPGQKAAAGMFAKNRRGPRQNFRLGAAGIGEQSLGRERRAQACDQVENGADRAWPEPRSGCRAAASAGSVWPSSIAPLLRARSSTGARSQPMMRPGEAVLLQGQPERTADQAGADDGDLANGHLRERHQRAASAMDSR